MRRVLSSWPVKAVVLAVSVAWIVGVAHAASESEQIQSELATEGGWDMYPAGSIPVPPKPKAVAGSAVGIDQFDLVAYPTGTIPVPPKPKAHEDGDAGLDAYPSGNIPIPPKPKAREEGDIGLDAYPAGTIPIPPNPNQTSNTDHGPAVSWCA